MTSMVREEVARKAAKGGNGRFRNRFANTVAHWQVLVVVVWLGSWELVSRVGLVDSFWVSRPSAIVPTVIDYLGKIDGWKAIKTTTYESLVGLAIGTVLGVATGVIMTRSQTLHRTLNPFVAIMNSTPRLALTPLFILWFGIDSSSKIVMVVALVYFVLLVDTISGIEDVDQDLVVVTRLLGASRREVTMRVIVPSIIPWILSGLRFSMGLAFSGDVVAEMIAGNGGLGFQVSYSAGVLDLNGVFAAVVLVMLLAYIADLLLRQAERRILKWRPSGLRV